MERTNLLQIDLKESKVSGPYLVLFNIIIFQNIIIRNKRK